MGDEVRAASDGAVAFGFDWHRCSGQEGSMHAARDVVNLSFQGLHLTADTPSDSSTVTVSPQYQYSCLCSRVAPKASEASRYQYSLNLNLNLKIRSKDCAST